ncbi:MAG: xanthine dehydrogenase family protein molybdopterin-binding subunit [Coprococcus sp.]
MRYVSQPVKKLDGMPIVKGKPLYTNDLAPNDCLIVLALRSPYAYARIKSIDTSKAMLVKGVECVLTYKDVPHVRFTNAGQTYPECSAYDRLILDEYVRYIGDEVALVAASNEKAALQALKMIKVEYEVLEPLLDYKKAADNPVIVHNYDDYFTHYPSFNSDNKRNIVVDGVEEHGDVDKEMAESDVIAEGEYEIQAQEQCMMETFRTYTYLDHMNRLVVVSSTQVPFHVRRSLARALQIPQSRIRVVKPRIGGGFGAKQTIVSEYYPAIVTLKTGKAAKMLYTRKEAFTCSNSRHQMTIKVRVGADKEGHIKAIELDTLSNQGAYGEHGTTTIGLAGHKAIPLYNQANAHRFKYRGVYTNTMPAAAFRGYGATQGQFALESTVNKLAHMLNMDPIDIREKNMLQMGEIMPAYYNEPLNSSALDRCIQRGREMIGWDEKYPCREISPTKVRSVGMAISMQGSGISHVDTAGAEIKLNDDGYYTLKIGATDMGTGCDTSMTQIAAETLLADMDQFIVAGVDTDISPFDPGSYASSTTYVTGMAVYNAACDLKNKIITAGAKMLYPDRFLDDSDKVNPKKFYFDGTRVMEVATGKFISIHDIAIHCAGSSDGNYLNGSGFYSSPVSPPPLMAGFVEIELDKETGQFDVVDYVGVVDCGTIINSNITRGQTEGGICQGIGLAMYEDVQYDKKGRMMTDSFMQYKIPNRVDVKKIRVEFESSYEPTGPYGAKSIGEIVVNTPAPAIADAVYNACGVRCTSLPITPEKVMMGMLKNKMEQEK